MSELNQSGLSGAERRESPRFDFRTWIEYFIVNDSGRILARQRSSSTDISTGGMAINSPQKLEPGTNLILRVPSKQEQGGFALTGLSVRWSAPIDSDGQWFRAGGAFVKVPAAFDGMSWNQLIKLWHQEPRGPVTKVQSVMPAQGSPAEGAAADTVQSSHHNS